MNENNNTCSRTGSTVGTPKDEDGRKTPSESRRKSLFDVMNEEDRKGRRSRDSDSDDSLERGSGKTGRSVDRKSPFAGRKSPYFERGSKRDLDDDLDKRKDRKSPFADRKSPYRSRSDDKIDSDEERRGKSPFGAERKGRRTPYEDEKESRRKSSYGRKMDASPEDLRRKTAGTGTRVRITVEERIHLTENETTARRVRKIRVILAEKETKV